MLDFNKPIQLDDTNFVIPEMPCCGDAGLESVMGSVKSLADVVTELKNFYEELNQHQAH